eukprot:8561836-Alexandrium_andersonii.AAC.1
MPMLPPPPSPSPLPLLARGMAQQLLGEGAAASAAVSALAARWGAELSAVLRASTARQLRTSLRVCRAEGVAAVQEHLAQ